jgi:DNA-binding IclR family transcriptional regulator
MARIVAAIGSEPGQNAKGLAARLGMAHSSVCRILRALDQAELITYENAAGGWFLVRKSKLGQSDRVPPGGRAP